MGDDPKFEVISGGRNDQIKTITVRRKTDLIATRQIHPFSVETPRGVLRGQAGDYLTYDPITHVNLVVPKKYLEANYVQVFNEREIMVFRDTRGHLYAGTSKEQIVQNCKDLKESDLTEVAHPEEIYAAKDVTVKDEISHLLVMNAKFPLRLPADFDHVVHHEGDEE